MATAQEKQFARLMAELSREETREELALLVSDPPAPPDFFEGSFPEQQAFIEDPARLKLALCTRRAGKSYGDGLYLFKAAYERPRCTVVYFGLTRLSAKFVMWRPVLDAINRKFNIGAKPNLSDLSWELPNGSMIYLLGVDSSEDEMKKAFGQKFRLAVVDEAALYRIDLKSLVYSVLQPATADEQGTICLTGMPSNLKRGLFFQLTQERQEDAEKKFAFDWLDGRKRWSVVDKENAARWSGHFWTGFENTSVDERDGKRFCDKWVGEIDEKKRNNPRIDETPFYQQEYLGQWVVDRDKWVYKYDADRNTFTELPEYTQGDWHYILGIDLGYEDDTAFCVMAYHENDPTAYVVETWSESKMDITDVVGHIKSAMIRYPGIGDIVVDGSNKQAVEEMRRRHDLWFMTSVQKKYKVGNSRPAKANMIEVMNADFIMGRIKIHPERCKSLIAEYENLIWDDRKDGLGPRQEHPGCANHNCFVAGTLVRTDDGERTIESLRTGDLVWTREGLRPVAVQWVSGVEPIWTLHTTAGTLRGTHDHPIWTQDGWKPLSALTQDDTLVSWEDSEPCRVLAVTPPRKDSHREPVHAVSVEGVHEYFANGILVSNCDSAFYSWLSVYSYLSEIADTPPATGTPAWQQREIAALELRDAQRMERQIVGARNAAFDDYDDGYSVIDVTEFFDA